MVCSLCHTAKEICRLIFGSIFRSYHRIREAVLALTDLEDQDYRELMKNAIPSPRFRLLCLMFSERQARLLCWWIRDFFFEWHAINPEDLYDEASKVFFPEHIDCSGEDNLKDEKERQKLATMTTSVLDCCFQGIQQRILWLHEIALTRAGILRQKWQKKLKKQQKILKKKMTFMPMPVIVEAEDESENSQEIGISIIKCNCPDCNFQ